MAQQAVERQAREEITKRNPFKGTRFAFLAELVSYANALLEPSIFRLKLRRPAEAAGAALETRCPDSEPWTEADKPVAGMARPPLARA